MDSYEFPKSRVYCQVDSENRITRIDGGYTISNIKNFDEWVYLDEGTGDRYNLCQGNYLDGPIYTDDGIPRYKLVDKTPVLRTDEEIDADRAARPAPEPTVEDILLEMMADHEYRLCMMELGGDIL